MRIAQTTDAPLVAGAAPSAPGQAAAAAPREVVARVLESSAGSLVLRIGRSTVEARTAVELLPGATVRLTVLDATPARVVLSLGGGAAGAAGARPDELTALLARTLAQAPAGPLARLLAGRGADAGAAAALAALFLAGEDSPIGALRRLAARDTKLRERLAAAEQAAVSGDGSAVRAAAAGLRAASTVPPDLARAQRLLDARPGEGAPSLLFLPLPGRGEARITLETGTAGERLESFRLAVELTLPHLGELSIELLGHQGAAFVTVRSPRGATVGRLGAVLPELEAAVEAALGRPLHSWQFGSWWAVEYQPPPRD